MLAPCFWSQKSRKHSPNIIIKSPIDLNIKCFLYFSHAALKNPNNNRHRSATVCKIATMQTTLPLPPIVWWCHTSFLLRPFQIIKVHDAITQISIWKFIVWWRRLIELALRGMEKRTGANSLENGFWFWFGSWWESCGVLFFILVSKEHLFQTSTCT